MARQSKLVDEVLRLGLAPVLRGAGFSKSSHTFRRTLDSTVQILNVQGCWTNTAGDESFTINLGVHFPQVDALTGKGETRRLPSVADALLNIRAGHLMGKGADRWWVVRSDSSLEAVAGELVHAWESHIKPWFARCESIPGALDFTRESELMGPAFLLALATGDRAEAARWLAVILAGTGGLTREWYREIAARQDLAL